MSTEQFFVVGGVYTNTDFKTIDPGQTEERYGPFATFAEARDKWAERSWALVDQATARFFIRQEGYKFQPYDFSLSLEEMQRAEAWGREQDKLWAEKQMQNGSMVHKLGIVEPGEAYYGAIGGELTYSFTPTGLGVITKVTHASGASLDLTDYNHW